MKIHWYFDSRFLKLLLCVDQSATGVWLEQEWRILKLLPCIDSSAARVTKVGLSVLHGWGLLFLELDLEEVVGVLNCFPGVLITGSLCLLDSAVLDPGDDTCNFNCSRICQEDHVRACPNWPNWFLYAIFNRYLISWQIGMNSNAQGGGYPF